MINISDDSENEDDEFMPTPKSSKATSPGPWTFATPPAGTAPRRQTVSAVVECKKNLQSGGVSLLKCPD